MTTQLRCIPRIDERQGIQLQRDFKKRAEGAYGDSISFIPSLSPGAPYSLRPTEDVMRARRSSSSDNEISLEAVSTMAQALALLSSYEELSRFAAEKKEGCCI